MTAKHMEKSCDVLPKEDSEGLGEYLPYVLVKHLQFCGYDLEINQYMNYKMGVSALIWECAFVLCQYFQQEKMNFSGKKVIELGSGTGIVGILAVLLGGEVTLTDESHALKQIEHNVSVNVPESCRHLATIRTLSWGFDHMNFSNDYDIILGSDIVYYPSDYPVLLQTLQHLSNPRTIIYIATRIRGCHETWKFHEELIPQYFNSHTVQGDWGGNIYLYKLTLKRPETGEEQPMARNLLSN
ncbi:EEF1A lysine methyltransferase 3-like [Scyliorhinus torazame]|uniref:EEF1A lysine methyltransferase 3-like n=1 Tax=Scyliorhinus torazame TaxID=75743 RepID=UPI003B5B1170